MKPTRRVGSIFDGQYREFYVSPEKEVTTKDVVKKNDWIRYGVGLYKNLVDGREISVLNPYS